MDRFKFNTEIAPDFFYIQNLKKKPTETFYEYTTRWRSEAAKVRPALEEEQMNKFFVSAQDPYYYERLMVIENHKFSDIIKLQERIEEGFKSGMAAGYVTPIPAVAVENSSQWVNTNKTCAYHSDIKGHIIDECRTLKDKIQTLTDSKIIQAKKVIPNVRNNPLPDNRVDGVHVIEMDGEWDLGGSIGLIRVGDDFKLAFTITPIVVQMQWLVEVEVTTSVPFEVEVASPTTTPALFEVEVATSFTMKVSTTPPFNSKVIPWDYVAEARRKGKAKLEESDVAQGMARTGRIYTPEHLGGSSKEASTKQLIIETVPDDLWRKVTVREYSIVDHLNKTLAQIYILSLLQNSEAHKNALIKVLNEDYVPNNITYRERANMVRQVLENHKITFHEDELPPEGLGKDFHEIWARSINVKAFDGSQRAMIGEINLCLEMGPTWFDVEF
ncbi:uncharacterized protein LOC142165875 [Nicotiana tabacum]|uniref:Uncharacterized protein LOC142165875 n=1 Tax=Nicotiana tabacum TaxID=4097 RepID=A0AC58S5U3_TOBAC